MILSGGGRIRIEDEIVDLRQWDAVQVGTDTMRAFEAGPDGLELLAFGAPHTGNSDAEMVPGWWTV